MSSSSDRYSDRYSDEACQQIKLDGEPCRAAALRGKKFCYYHLHSGPPPKDVSNPGIIPQVQFHLPLLDDATSIQATISLVCEHLLHRRLEPKKAGILLYAMQVASSNLSRMNEDRNQKKNGESNSTNPLQAPPSDPASSDTPRTAQDDSGATPSDDPDRLPPGTIQACQQRKRSVV
ncbi:MAG: hypothetical protein ABSG23_15365 [Terriglobales bacterium]|jgi:hypothetical protein